jgi:hypothetical protein
MLQVRDHIVELIYLQLILLMNSLSFGVDRCLEDADFVPVNFYLLLAVVSTALECTYPSKH